MNTLRNIVEEYERARGAPLSLEEKLRLSVAENDANKRKEPPVTTQHEDLYEAIEKRRGELLEDLEKDRAAREELSKRIKAHQDALDALPVPRTRRSKKAPAQPTEGV